MWDGVLFETQIVIEKPFKIDDNKYSCKITFSNVPKYNASSKGIDEFNAMECALDYVGAICENSDDPEFFMNEGESMKGFDRTGGGIL
ncbi:hypothetical protein KK137_15715 [Croceibacterium sp. LX-88]|uniref:Phage protein n=1 Tax=Croceibacterium selenioxidans TaxID=2838833 RepID=A0ABS5W7Q4_9SPHN|nr:hypothetical protein [Croceibacterium selenioxidans]MBT2135786.1 hypothetical protein [Croceibacterium selenioxidans]